MGTAACVWRKPNVTPRPCAGLPAVTVSGAVSPRLSQLAGGASARRAAG